MSEQLSKAETSNPKKKLKWYWWVLIIIGVLYIIGSLAPDSPPVSTKELVAKEAQSDNVATAEKPKLTAADIDKKLAGLRKSTDEFQKMSFYHDPSTTKYNNVNALYVYLGRNESNEVWPRLTIQYAGESWIFVKMYKLLIDGQTRVILPEEKVTRDNNGDGVWEVIDQTPSLTDLAILNELAKSKVAKIRYEGQDKVFDRVISDKEKRALKRMLEIYNSIKA